MAVAWKLRASTVILGIVLLGCIFSLSVAEDNAYTVIGIDLGTSYSRVGVYNNESFVIIVNDQGNRRTPSWVAFTDSERLIGEDAKNQTAVNPERTIFNVKRLIGRKFEDEEVQMHMKLVPYKVVNRDGKLYIQIQIKDGETKVFSPEEISAMILTKMKETAEAYLGKEIEDAVISVPCKSYAQKQAIKEACTIAGLNVLRFVYDLSAAAISIGLEKKVEKNILVFGLGGGSFEVSISIVIEDRVFEVLERSGDTHPGGEDFDQRIVEYFIEMIKEKHGKDISKDNRAFSQLRREAERAKRALSTQHEVHVEIESLFDGIDFSEPLTMARFEELNSDLFRKTMASVKKVMEDSGLKKNQIDEIILVGGSTKIPKIQQLLKDYFDGKEPNKDVNPDEAVAYGAAFIGDFDSRSIMGKIMKSFINMPGRISYCFLIRVQQLSDDHGPSIEVTPFALGIETVGGVISTLIPKHFVTPTKKSQVFTTHQDQQTTVTIQVFECEEGNLTKDCRFLGMFDLTGISPAPSGTPQIEVTFEIDANGILNVKAEDKASGRSEIKIVMGRWSQDEIDARKERLDARNNGLMAYTGSGSQISDKDKLEQDENEKTETVTKEELGWLKRIIKFWTRCTTLLNDEHDEL